MIKHYIWKYENFGDIDKAVLVEKKFITLNNYIDKEKSKR